MLKTIFAAAATFAVLLAAPATAQDNARIEWKTLHSKAMEGNLEGNSADRGAFVVTPPGYDQHTDKRYPVVYFLHGYWATPQMYEEMMKFEEAVDGAAKAGNEVIMVIPDGYSKLKGGFYSNSPTVGNYEAFVGEDLVAWVDGNYRTIARRESRGLSGHSMGGYGTMRVGMKYPQVFSSLYAMSACCLSPMSLDAATAKRIAGMTDDDIAKADFGGLAAFSTLATWSPDPTNPPHYVYTGLKEDGTLDPLVNARLTANSIIAMLPQYLPALRSYEAIGLEVGDKDFLIEDNKLLNSELTRFGIKHGWKTYDGDHGNRIHDRIRSELLPFFAGHLDK
jgi:enterochelin esterase-like enzyme